MPLAPLPPRPRGIAQTRACDIPHAPVDAWRTLIAAGHDAALLDSAPGFGNAGRWSILAIDPYPPLQISESISPHPLARLKSMLQNAGTPPRDPDSDAPPFTGGWLGFFAYDIIHCFEHLRTRAPTDHAFPAARLPFYRTVLTMDRFTNEWSALSLTMEDETTDDAEARLESALSLLRQPPPPRVPGPALHNGVRGNFTRKEYLAAVRRILDYIEAGDIYQVNLAQRFEGESCIPLAELAARLAESSPAPFAAYLRHGNQSILSASPERFLRLCGREVETWPIKGTRPRGMTDDEDARLLQALRDSEKEKAELAMITDLLRNDLGRVCEYGTVRVNEPRRLESFRHVHHARSVVTGRLRHDADLTDLLRATLPGGSVTGAPKIRACEIIEELEPVARGVYCGSVGYIGTDGRMDLNIAIRTLTVEENRVRFSVGGGIVADSEPAAEYEETLHKAAGLLQALGCTAPGESA